MKTILDNSNREVTVKYETNRGGIKTIRGVIVERPVFETSAPYRLRTDRGDVWAKVNGHVSNSDRQLGYTISVEVA